MTTSINTEKYSQRGVSADKEDVHQAIKKLNRGLYPKAFCKVVKDYLTNDEQYCLVMHADGAGTKSILAYLYWKETGDLSVWKGIAQDSLVMNIDDLLCVGITTNFMLSSTINRNKGLIPGEVISAIINGTEEIILELDKLGVCKYATLVESTLFMLFTEAIRSTGGETADMGDLLRTIVVDSTVFARSPRKDIIDNENIQAGDVIVGLASYGQTTYESEYNSGIGSNGLTSARHDVFSKNIALKYPEAYDPALPDHLVYSGDMALTDKVEVQYELLCPETNKVRTVNKSIDVAKLVLSPTRTYSPIMRKILEQIPREKIHGIIHCSGGAQTKVMHFIDDLHVIKDNMFPTPILFNLIKDKSGTTWKEMYKVYNMGHRLEIYTSLETANVIIEVAKSFNVDAQIVGRVEKSQTGKKLTIKTEHGVFEYI